MPINTPHQAAAGLCGSCQHARLTRNDRGSVFIMCEASKTHVQLTRYPRLPMLQCPVYQPVQEPDEGPPNS